ncbi:thioredoxin-domain-containing protein [Exidia glandulosa HHB12029]|uniref:Thioredoxin-domain-containing protein n=1 Tax=Exidia glandulosa HHB12029 TaxID=1314781 RepID=A0A165BEQ1_EXIGL|nr:thioredoxin-domain-containing protein [Exidia glandulosa HHB12029]
MSGPIEISTVTEWNTSLRAAKEANRAVIVDFHAQWCGPCKQIAPFYAQLAGEHTGATWLRVDVDGQGTRPIATKYQITAMPTFLVIRDGQVVDTLRGADPRGLIAIAKKHAVVTLHPDAERAKSEGNKVRASKSKRANVGERAEALGDKAFTSGDYAAAVEHYTTALKHEPKSAVLYGNRSIAYLKLAAEKDTPGGENYRPKALGDAVRATELDPSWPKGWVRLAEATLAAGEDDAEVAPEKRAEGKRMVLEGAQEALENAVRIAPEGKVKAEAQKMLDDVRTKLSSQ